MRSERRSSTSARASHTYIASRVGGPASQPGHPTHSPRRPRCVNVVATKVPQPQQLAHVRRVLINSVSDVHQEDGCELYALHQAGAALIFIEQWSSQAALDRHTNGNVVRRVKAAIDGSLMEPPTLVTATAVPAGVPQRGQLVAV